MNVGANAPEKAGLFFSWGNTDGHAEGSGYDFSQNTYDETEAAAITTDLSLNQDMARANLGQPWRLPTKEEFQELYDNCTSEWTTLDGVNGRLFTSNVNGNSIFFPAAGYYNGMTLIDRDANGRYWASSYGAGANAYNLNFNSSIDNPQNLSQRHNGFSVRAVLGDN